MSWRRLAELAAGRSQPRAPAGVVIDQVDPSSRSDVRRFVDLPYRLHAGRPQWVPPLRSDETLRLDRRRHPFYDHSEAAFFVAVRDGHVVGRIAALENRRFNAHHRIRDAHFSLLEIDDAPGNDAVAAALFGRLETWARGRGLDTLTGPMGFGPLEGNGLLVDGFEHRQLMTMMNYNPPTYPRLVEALGFRGAVDFVSFRMTRERISALPERIRRIAERTERLGALRIQSFRSVRELRAWALRVGAAYNAAFVDNWEYHPLTEREIMFVVDNLSQIVDPRLIKLILHEDEVAGFVLAYPDVSTGLQRARGRLFPFGFVHLLLDRRRTRALALHGAGILPRWQGHGGNALLYLAIERVLIHSRYDVGDVTQNADTAVRMRADITALGAEPYKRHRVYRRALSDESAADR